MPKAMNIRSEKAMASRSEESCSSNATEGERQPSEFPTRRQVYRIPREKEEHKLLVHMVAEWIIQLLVFQVKIVIQAFSAMRWALSYCYSVVAELVQRTMQAKDRSVEAVSQKLAIISQVAPKLAEGGVIVMRKLGFGCLAATCACTILTALMSIAALFGFAFVTLWVEEPVIIRQPLYFDYTQPHPTAIVSFVPSNGIQQQKASGRRLIPAGHRFSVTVTLVMPESDCNRQIGMFQLTAEIISTGDKILARSSQPCMLHFVSTQIRLTKTFLMSLPLLMGILGETQTVTVHVIDYQEKNAPTGSIRIRLQPKAGTIGLPELYSAQIDIHSQLPWIKELARNWKWTICVWSSMIFYFLLVGWAICCCKHATMLRLTTTARNDQETLREGAEDLSSELTDNRLPKPSRRHGGSTSQRWISFAQESQISSFTSVQHVTGTAVRLAEQRERYEISEEFVTDENILASEQSGHSI